MDVGELFTIKIVDKRMQATIYCTEVYKEFEGEITEKQLKDFLKSNQVVYGISEEVILNIVNKKVDYDQFPLIIATGIEPIDGEDGFVAYTFNENTDSSSDKKANFRDVMNIPSVKENDEIAKETLPTKGKPGTNISGITIQPRPGKRKIVRAGKNVHYDKSTLTYYATAKGQVSMGANRIDVHDLFTVSDTLSMETGNVDFVGSVEVHGDVPTGYTIKAGGDIRIHGLVEAATIHAGGSVFISEGFAALQKGTISAEGDVHVSYINQGDVWAGQSIYVENSILHSTCKAEDSIICERGNITGGSTTAGYLIEARDIGNRVQTKTKVMINEDEQVYEEEEKLMEELQKVQTTIDQLKLIGEKLSKTADVNDANMRVTLLRQKSSLQKATMEKQEIQQNIDRLRENYFHDGKAIIIVKKELFGNVAVTFGKYEQTTQRDYTSVQCSFQGNEISIVPL